MKKPVSILMAAVLTAAMLTGCSSTPASNNSSSESSLAGSQSSSAAESSSSSAVESKSTADGEAYNVGIIQLSPHTALDASNKGFCDALAASGLNVNIDQQNAQGDQSACQTIATKLVGDKNDLILAIATPAAQAVAGATTDIPVLATAVTDFVEAGLVNAADAPGTNVTGTSDLTPVKEQMDLLVKLLPEAKKVGILYCSAEVNSSIQADLAKEACAALGLSTEVFTVSSSNEIQTVVESMVGKVDVIYAPTDNTIANSMSTVGMVATDNKLPVICGESGMVTNGGLATYGIDYYQLGYMVGEMAVSILKGEATPDTMPIGYLDAAKCELAVNEEVAKALNIDLSVLD